MKTFSLACATLLVLAACGDDPAADDAGSSGSAGGSGEGGAGGGGNPGCATHDECSAETPFCEPTTGECIEPPPGSELGWGDGSPASVTWTVIFDGAELNTPVDLGFDPSASNVLWVLNKRDDSVVILTDPGTDTMTLEARYDPAASHFMANPPAFAFGSVDETWGQTFGVCGDGDNGGNDFMGPALFSARLDVFADDTPTGLGSHLDMLHSTTFCRGIAHGGANIYYLFNGARGSIDAYDFGQDHDPGNENHADGRILRFIDGTLTGVEGVSSHLAFDAATGLLYISDTGAGRVLALDIATGTIGSAFGGSEPIAERVFVDGATTREAVPAGSLQAPSGIELKDGLVFVADTATSRISAFDAEGALVRFLDTGLAPNSLSGFTFGPDGKLYLIDVSGARVLRVDPMTMTMP